MMSFVSILYNNKASDCQSIIFKSIGHPYKFPPANIGESVKVFLPDIMSAEDEQTQETLYIYSTLPQLYTRNQISVSLLSLIPLGEVVHVEKSLKKIASLKSAVVVKDTKSIPAYKGKCDTNRCKCKSSRLIIGSGNLSAQYSLYKIKTIELELEPITRLGNNACIDSVIERRVVLFHCLLDQDYATTNSPGMANPNDLAGHFLNTSQSCGPHIGLPKKKKKRSSAKIYTFIRLD
ncbi:Uncharacterized protein FWK35_00004831 [Aphis craccivora]|uniref:Uncharacterized protein n=1 Tax=Aphis craccivora TaxID=307492 RepID=A0A6G0ZI48_APHCR|nr:Uncharacterized protein FWK35_00004831 [Aphis craccivora]